ncbi:hypothetical protein TanjilG_19014 [Lupinus angustifolius]|uniref:Leucine-rich repeat-containing N-terminal plant-type domain-containing protein n=1 Tax=Lupinus angustifolius TaxID=3871 RepID=A0A4P1RQW1_LUPAN|nr:hypothetical protein TanjilG_19014 [Lupinus angustifolius]
MVSGSLGLEFSQLKELEVIDAYDNMFNSSLPLFVLELPKLKHLNFGKLINLVHLDIANCGMIGPIPSELSKLYKLDTLFLQTNHLNVLHELTLLNLFINMFNGEIPHFIAELPNLEVLKLWQNNFTGVIPSMLDQNGKLTELDLSTNKLTGPVPKSLCLGKRLKILILLNNFLFGSLPSDLGQCYTLRRVLFRTELFDRINTERRNPLRYRDLSTNNFSSSIPAEIRNCVLLTYLDLSQNQLSGPIPIQVSQIHTLNYLNVSWNHLNQTILMELGAMKGLTSADFSHNNFSGSVPNIGQFSVFNSTSFEGPCPACRWIPTLGKDSTNTKENSFAFSLMLTENILYFCMP